MPDRRSEVERSDLAQRDQIAPPGPDLVIARIAERQSGVVARPQLLTLGLSPAAIGRRVDTGRLHRLHRGVYAVGHRRVDRRGRWLAAVLACGPGAVRSHRSAAALWDLDVRERTRIDVTTANRNGGGSPHGVALHRVRSLPAAEVAASDGVSATSVARTLLDLAGICTRRELERACERAELLRLFDRRQLEAALARANGRRGARALRALLDDWSPGATLTRSALEERLLSLVRGAGLPQPRLNAIVLIDGGRRHVEVDALWMPQRLAVEVDGCATHGTSRAFERDRERDVALQLAGYRPARFTERQVTERPRAVAQTLAGLLDACAA